MKEEREEKKREEKKLLKKQLALLVLVYRFRFVTIALVMAYEGQRHHESVRRRLDELVDRGLLLKRVDNSYSIDRRPAEYTLTPVAIPVLRGMPGISERELKQLYVRSEVSARFISHSLGIFEVRNLLYYIYDQGLSFVTKSQLNVDEFNYLPDPLPDAFMTISHKANQERHFFVEYFDDALSVGLHGRKIARYMSYKNDGGWDETDLPFPTILIVCQSTSLLKRAETRVRYLERQFDSEVSFRLIDLTSLRSIPGSESAIWVDPITQVHSAI